MIVVQTPLRISFLGGGTDFEGFYKNNSGAVLSTAIDKSVFVIVKERFDNRIYLNWSKKEIVDKVDDIEHELIREAMRITEVKKGIEITILSDIPSEGSGLGSSSSITVGLLQALYTYQNKLVTARELAEQACKIEIDILGKPIGKQDQYIVAYGGMRFITFGKEVKVESIDCNKRKLGESLMLLFTGTTRQSSEILKEQKANIRDTFPILEEIRNLTYLGREDLEKGEFNRFGELIHCSWNLKKKLASKITNHGIDKIYTSALKAGAIGGKILGGGGGGFMLLYCPVDKRDKIRETLELRELPFRFEQDGSKVIFNYRR